MGVDIDEAGFRADLARIRQHARIRAAETEAREAQVDALRAERRERLMRWPRAALHSLAAAVQRRRGSAAGEPLRR